MASPSRRRPKLHFSLLLLLVFIALFLTPAHPAKNKPKKAPPPKKKKDSSYSNKGKRFFWLIDPRDKSCLGAQGFGMCDGSTAWIIAERKEGNVLVSLLENDKSDMCLERKWCHSPVSPVSTGPCKNCGSKHWYVRASEAGGKREEGREAGGCCFEGAWVALELQLHFLQTFQYVVTQKKCPLFFLILPSSFPNKNTGPSTKTAEATSASQKTKAKTASSDPNLAGLGNSNALKIRWRCSIVRLDTRGC